MINRKINFLTWILVLLVSMVGVAYANPITVTDIEVQEVRGGEWLVLVSVVNANVTTGKIAELDLTLQELGTTVTKVITADSSDREVLAFNLEDVVSSPSMLKRGNTYSMTAAIGDSSKVDSFSYGRIQTEGLDIVIEDIQIDDISVSDIETLQVLNGAPLEVEVRFTAQSNFDDARLRVSLDGYEHDVIDDSTKIFEVVAGKTYVKKMFINIPADIDSEKDYTLRVTGANDFAGLTIKELSLFVDTQRHRVDVLDLVMTPSSGVEPGQNIIANVRMKNRGQKEQDSVRVSVEVPGLGISEASYVSNLGTVEAVTSDDMLLFIPRSAKAGQYPITVRLAYNDGYTESVEAFSLNVLSPLSAPEKNLLVSFRDNIGLKAGEEKTFEIVVANPNERSRPISLTALDNAWATVETTPSLSMVKGGESSVFIVKVTPKKAITGERDLKFFVKEGSEAVSEVTVQTYVETSDRFGSGFNWVNVVLAVVLLVAIVVFIALIVTIVRRKAEDGDQEELNKTEEYY